MKDSYYFQHDYNAINDPKMMMLLSSCGLSGIGIYRIIIEILHQQDDCAISVESYKQYISFYSNFESKGLFADVKDMSKNIGQILISCGLLCEKDGFIFSERVLKNKNKMLEIKEKRSFAGKMSAEKRSETKETSTSVEHVSTSVEHIPTKEKKRKEKKRKEISLYNGEKYSFVENFLNKENPQIKYQMTKQGEEIYLNKQFEEIEKLKKDGFPLDAIEMVLKFIKQDSFWSKNILSIKKLREKDKNGIPYIVRMIDEIQKRKPQNKISSLPGIE